jgi:drug/metabolite transporter (DMT)-like permease
MSKASAPATGRLGLGIVLIILAFFCFALISAFAKAASPGVSSGSTVFFQYAISLVILAPWLLRHGWKPLVSHQLRLQGVWSLFGLLSQFLLFVALISIPLVDAVLLANASPLFIPLVSWAWLKTRIPAGLWVSLIVGFVGIVLILQPGVGAFSWGTPVALVAGICSAIGLTTVGRLQATEPSERLLFWYFLLSSILAIPLLLQNWSMPDTRAWLLLLGIGVCMAASQILTIIAYRQASAATLAPFNYSVVVFSALIGWLVWNEVPNWLSAVGVVLVCVGGILATRQHAQPPGPPPLARAGATVPD